MIVLAGTLVIHRLWSPPDPRTENLTECKLRSGYLAHGDNIHPPINDCVTAKRGIDMAKNGALRGIGLNTDRAALDPELLACSGLEILVAQSIPAFSLEPDATALCGAMTRLDQMLCPSLKFCLHGL
jgi:hypothetical protein